MQYARYFIPLVCEAKGFDYKGRQPIGRCVLEARGSTCKATCWAQDLKPETLYALYLLFKDGSRCAGVPVGPIPVDAKGKAEIRHELEMDRITERFPLTQCAGVAVMAVRAAEPTAVLFGSREAGFVWRYDFYDVTKLPLDKSVDVASEPPVETTIADQPDSAQEEAVVVMEQADTDLPLAIEEEQPPVVMEQTHEQTNEQAYEPSLELPADSLETEAISVWEPEPVEAAPVFAPLPPAEQAPKPEPPYQPEATTKQETVCIPEPTPQPEPPYNPEPEIESIPEPPPIDIPKPSEACEKDIPSVGDMARQFHQALEAFNRSVSVEENARVEITDEVDRELQRIFAQNAPMQPFHRQNRTAKWVRVSPEDRVPPPVNAPNLFEEDFLQEAYRRYGHWIVGLTTDGGRRLYIIGAPASYDHEQKPHATRLGFSQFKTCDDTKTARGKFGYWLMFINA